MSAERLLTRRRGDADGESGMTVIEVVVASALLLVVLALVLGLMTSLSSNETRTQALVHNEQAVRFVLNDFARDVRQADPLTIWPSTADYSTKLQMEIGPEGARTHVRWVYDSVAKTLARQVVADASPTAAVLSSVTRATRVRNLERGIPLLQYFDSHAVSDADELVVTGTSPVQIANCSIRVRITVAADSQPGPEPFVESLDVHLRNRLPGGVGC